MSLIAKVEWVEKIGDKYDYYDAYTLYYEEIGPAILKVKEAIDEAKSILAWLAKSSDAKACDASFKTTRLKEVLEMVLEEIHERKDHLEGIKKRLEKEEESDEEYFNRAYGRRPEENCSE